MSSLTALDLIIVLAASALAATVAFRMMRPGIMVGKAHSVPSLAFHVKHGQIHGTCEDGSKFIRTAPSEQDDFEALLTVLQARFPRVHEETWNGLDPGRHVFDAAGETDPAYLEVDVLGDGQTITLNDPRAATPTGIVALHQGFRGREHSDRLERLAQAAPYPVWMSARNGTVLWSNSAYRTLTEKLPEDGDNSVQVLTGGLEQPDPVGETRRVSVVTDHTTGPLWFDVSSLEAEDGIMNYALDVTPVVNAEVAQRNFVQTLTKTFAQLSIGLAIFDRSRQLALFNPALIDLTHMPADFLSARPTLLSFFDRLRDAQMMPEPKDYPSWRDRFADLVAAASDGRYSETWSLPNEITYRVTGRPHPDGAIAFLFEDISAEITLARRYRAELDRSHAVFDGLHIAVAVFAPSGTMTFVNRAYRSLWGADPELAFAETTILDATRHWQEKCRATPVWGDLREFVVDFRDRVEWGACVQLADGAELLVRCIPLPGNVTAVTFADPAETALIPAAQITEDA